MAREKTGSKKSRTRAPRGRDAKKVKDTRSKAQIKADDELVESRKLLDYWIKLKSFILLAFGDKELTVDHEQQFLALMTGLQKQERAVLQFAPRDIDFGSGKMGDMLRNAISLDHLRDQPESDKEKLYGDWHSIYILMTRAVGAMAFVAEGYKHVSVVQSETGLSDIKKGRSGADVPWHKNPSVLTGLAVGAVFTVFLLDYLEVINLF